LNQVLKVKTSLTPQELIDEILKIEKSLGRERQEKYGPRLIDIDILFFDNEVIKSKSLTIPHPQLHNRRFVLVPLNEIAPRFIHPVLKKSIAQLLLECPDKLDVNKI
jgi:2-amino-4-hydroxy-6-hydroxymethyldihydropteridine diphosphokinase